MSIIAHNLLSMNAQRQFGINSKAKAKSAEKLSSGLKINRSADDAAGLAISEKMRRQIRGLTQGVENSQDGVSLCQVADGALAQVDEMLHRVTELAVKSANGTNSEEDREYIQREIQQILAEIDRIGDSTTFNDRPVFKGTDELVLNADGSVASMDDIEFPDLQLTDVNLGKTPLRAGEGGDMLHLQAIVGNTDSALNGKTFNLIYGSGTTSTSSFRITDASGNKTVVTMDELTSTNFTSNGTNEWSREFTYSSGTGMDVGIKQTVQVQEGADEKNYVISYEFSKSADVANLEFMFHADTAYNNNDLCEGYFINGTRVDKYCVYSQNGSQLTDNATSAYVYNGMPDSLSIVDMDKALAFSEKVSFGSGKKPDSFSIGHYNEIHNWSYYESLDSELGTNAARTDLGYSLYYDMGDLSQDNSLSFNYGIASVSTDQNLAGVTITPDTSAATNHHSEWSVWIQSGTEAGSGLNVTIGEMDTDVLGLRGLDVSTVSGAKNALKAVKGALHEINDLRSTIGAQQNRIEHIISSENNIVENTTAAESRIRDTDMAKEMVKFSNDSILEQVGHAMIAQANQSNQGVLNLLT